MSKLIATAAAATLFCLPALHKASAQMIVHATAGTIAPASSPTRLSIKDTEQNVDIFAISATPNTVNFDKSLREKTQAPNQLPKTATTVIVYYYGYSPETAVAVKDLGPKVDDISGTVTHTDSSHHTVTVHTTDGKDTLCYVSPETTIDTPNGVQNGARLGVHKGDKLSIVCTPDAGKEDAQFIEIQL